MKMIKRLMVGGVAAALRGEDAQAVVDARLRVHGIGRLRVIDGSVMPSVVSGNTNAAIIMIAEKGAEMILEEAASQPSLARAASF